MITRIVFLVTLVASVAGCAQIRAVDYALRYHSVSSDLADAVQTPAAQIPESGQATFDGVAILGLRNGVQAMGLAGRAELNAAFAPGGGTISGEIRDFAGAEIDPNDLIASATARLGNMDIAQGTVAVTGGMITGNHFTANFNGDLTYDNSDLTVAGTMEGGFFGDDASLIEAKANAETGSINVLVNQDTADAADLYLIARSE